MLRFLKGIVGFAVAPLFIEAKAVLLAYAIFANGPWSIVAAAAGLLFVIGVIDGGAFFAGAKSLFHMSILIQKAPNGCITEVETIAGPILMAEYGYWHRMYRFGRFSRNAGNLKLLYDKCGVITEYQCAFNLYGDSYVLGPSDLPFDKMRPMQKYLTLHEMGHGSFEGGTIWSRKINVISSGLIACLFGVIIANVTVLGGIALAATLFVTVAFSLSFIIRTHAEMYADSYALAYIAREDRGAAERVAESLLEKSNRVSAASSRIERFEKERRTENLHRYLGLLRSEKWAGPVILHPPQRHHYICAALLFLWVAVDIRAPTISPAFVAGGFFLLLIASIIFRNHSVVVMTGLAVGIERFLNDGSQANQSK